MNKQDAVRVRITKAENWRWYGGLIDKEFMVKDIDKDWWWVSEGKYEGCSILKSDCEVIPPSPIMDEKKEEEHIHIPLKNHEGHATYIGKPPAALVDAVNRMADLAYEKLSPKVDAVQGEQKGWISTDEKMPEHNVGVLVFIPEEDYHVTSGMWDISNKWCLLDDYRVPDCKVTHWKELPDIPEEYQKQRQEGYDIMKRLKEMEAPLKKAYEENEKQRKSSTRYPHH